MEHEPHRLTRRRNEHWGVEPDPELEDQLEDVTGAYEVVNRRRILWRDSAFILIGVVVALLLAQILLPGDGGTGSDKPTELPTGAVLGLTSAPRTMAPGETLGPLGPILDPSLGIDATPIPVITPRPTRRPTPAPSAAPGATPSPTPKITPTPTKTPSPPTPAPTVAPTPEITPTPPPHAVVSCEQTAPLTVSCASSSTDIQDNSESWAMGDSGVFLAGGDGSASITFAYTGPGLKSITLTVTGLDGATTDSASVPLDVTL